jgi:hypothetical protein
MNGTIAAYDALGAKASQLGIASINAAQLMDLTLLHAMAHSFGMQHGTDAQVAEVDKAIWKNCFN